MKPIALGSLAICVAHTLHILAATAADDPARLHRIHATKMPPMASAVPFDTPEADAILAALEVFPPDNAWNQLITNWPLHPDSKAIVASVGDHAYVAPATHHASKLTDTSLPRMGERFRLRQDFDVSGFSPAVRTILIALKRYGMFVADNGIEWAISVAPDERIPDIHEELRRVKGADFEVVVAPE